MSANLTRRGFFLSLLAAAATSTILTDVDLLDAAPAGERWADVVRKAREHVALSSEIAGLLVAGLLRDVQDADALSALSTYRQRRDNLLNDLHEIAMRQANALMESDRKVLIVAAGEFRRLNSGERDPQWGWLDEHQLEALADKLVPVAVYSELYRRRAVQGANVHAFELDVQVDYHSLYLPNLETQRPAPVSVAISVYEWEQMKESTFARIPGVVFNVT